MTARRWMAAAIGASLLLIAARTQGAEAVLEEKDADPKERAGTIYLWLRKPSARFRQIEKLPDVPMKDMQPGLFDTDGGPHPLGAVVFEDPAREGIYRLVIDLNRDKDLSNDTVIDLAKKERDTVSLTIQRDGKPVEFLVDFCGRKGKWPQVHFWPRKWREGVIDFEGRKMRVAFARGYHEGENWGHLLYLDRNGDGAFDSRTKFGGNIEKFPLGKYLLIGRKVYEPKITDSDSRLVLNPYEGPTGILEFKSKYLQKGAVLTLSLVAGHGADEKAFWFSTSMPLLVTADDASYVLPVGDYSAFASKFRLKGVGTLANIVLHKLTVSENKTSSLTLLENPLTEVTAAQSKRKGEKVLKIERKTTEPGGVVLYRRIALVKNGKADIEHKPKVEVLKGTTVISCGAIGYG